MKEELLQQLQEASVKRTNKSIEDEYFLALLARLVTSFIPSWLRLAISLNTSEIPFNIYGTKAVIPVEMLIQTKRVAMVNAYKNKDSLKLDLALAEEKCNLATIHLGHFKNKMEKYYKKCVRSVTFQPSDHVMRRNEVSKAASQGKLAPN
ncbi:reverse transcriptase domain-containing protein [Artemisia annua]|uniref:Reverse transcriptase domain-containing protein n=1 Tax=Artemisia annua TaxID=35608 RepID=A0A2U1LVM8_ARTAN|nr:reverse transcriptase domain-containing protein [Artemisia annua]